jgi:hypothetical protein
MDTVLGSLYGVDQDRCCNAEISEPLGPENVSRSEADWTIVVKSMIVVLMKGNSEEKEHNEKNADGNSDFEV